MTTEYIIYLKDGFMVSFHMEKQMIHTVFHLVVSK